MKCWWIFFHKWPNWDEPHTGNFIRFDNTTYSAQIQCKVCEKCNKKITRYV